MKQQKYTLTVCLNITDPDTGEILDTQTETEYFDTRTEAEEAAARYRAGEAAGEYLDGTEITLVSADVSDTPQEVDVLL